MDYEDFDDFEPNYYSDEMQAEHEFHDLRAHPVLECGLCRDYGDAMAAIQEAQALQEQARPLVTHAFSLMSAMFGTQRANIDVLSFNSTAYGYQAKIRDGHDGQVYEVTIRPKYEYAPKPVSN